MWDVQRNIFFIKEDIACVRHVVAMIDHETGNTEHHDHTMPIWVQEEQYST